MFPIIVASSILDKNALIIIQFWTNLDCWLILEPRFFVKSKWLYYDLVYFMEAIVLDSYTQQWSLRCSFNCMQFVLIAISLSIYQLNFFYNYRKKNHSHGNNASQSLKFWDRLQKCMKGCMSRPLGICHSNLSFIYYFFSTTKQKQ